VVEISLIRPSYMFLLALIPVIIFIHFWMLRKRRGIALSFANFDAISRVKGLDLLSKNIFVLIITALIAVLLVLSLSGLNVQRDVFASSFSFSIAIDTSRSMEADDFYPNRLEAAKEAAIQFTQISEGSKMAVVSFSGNALMEQSLTDDISLVRQAINGIPISAIGGTDLAEAVLTSTNLLEGEEQKAIILLSDGRINVGTIETAIDYASANNVIIHTIGMGTEEGGITSYGSLTTLDEDALKALAHNTGGQYFRASSQEMLGESFNSILDLKLGRKSFDVTHYTIIAALILLFVLYILVNTRYKTLP